MLIPPELNETIAALLDNAVFALSRDKKTAEQVLKEIQKANPQWVRRVKPSLNDMRIKK